MNTGRTFLTSQENRVIQNGDPGIPVTPQKPVANLVPAEMQGNRVERGDWNELLGLYGDYLLQTTRDSRVPSRMCDKSRDTTTFQNPVEPVYSNNGHIDHRNDAAVEDRSFDMNISHRANTPYQGRPACIRVDSLTELLGMMNKQYLLSASGRSSKNIHLRELSPYRGSYSQVQRRYEQYI